MKFQYAAPFIIRPRYEERGLLIPRKYIDGQWQPGQKFQFQDGNVDPPILSAPISIRASGATGSTGTGLTLNVALPASIVAGELLLLFAAAEDVGSPTLAAPAGWTRIPNFNYGAATAGTLKRFCGFYKVASGSEGATVACTFAGPGALDATAGVSVAVSNHQGTPESSVTSASFSTANPNPDSVSPSWGAASESLFLSIIAFEQDAVISVAPTGYSLVDSAVGGTTRIRLAVHSKIATAASDDPSAYTLASSQQGWTATAAVRGP